MESICVISGFQQTKNYGGDVTTRRVSTNDTCTKAFSLSWKNCRPHRTPIRLNTKTQTTSHKTNVNQRKKTTNRTNKSEKRCHHREVMFDHSNEQSDDMDRLTDGSIDLSIMPDWVRN